MAPNCPEEIDVFSIPHSRMKELVQKYLIMVSEINFADTSHLTNLLENLVNTFKEFKAHEHIENKYIMKKLKEKLKTLSIRSTALCNCHSDNRLTDMLELVQDGYKCTQKTEIDRNNFGRKLRKALEEFTEKFIPHMEEEEEVFQPMLIKYFTFDELREIKCKVLEKHFCRSDKCVKAKLREKAEFALSDSSDEECSEKLELTKDNQTTDRIVIDRVPDEVTIKIFTYLNPQELGRCAQVSQHWNRLALDGSLWRNFLPVQWSKGDWSFVSSIHVEEEEKLLQNENSWGEIIIDEDADVDESGENDDIELVHQIKKEADMLTCMMKYLLPRIGLDIKTINLAYSKGLVNGLLYKILSLCPLVENLDLTHTRVSDLGFKSLGKNGCGSLLKKIDLTGCHNITDVTLERLSKALNSVPVVRHYEIEEEKNEIESNEKGMKSKNMDDTCHSTCMQDLNTTMIDNVCNKTSNVQSMNDIEDHFQMNSFKKPISFANQFTNYAKIVADCSGEDNCDVDEISPKLTFNDGVILSANKNSTNCCSQTNGQESSVMKCSKHYTEIVFCKHLDADEQKTIKSSGIDCENICDKLNCRLEFLNLSGCFLITDRGIRALVENLTFPQLQYLDLSGCDQLTSDSLTELVSVCTSLDHQFLYYCDNITKDPYFDSASGCQNLECSTRSCCRTSY